MTDARESEKYRPKCKPCLVALVVFGLWGLASLGWMGEVVRKVLSGQGLQTYRTFWLVEFNYIGAFVLILAGCLVVLVGVFLQAREWWLLRDLEKKYGKGRSQSNSTPHRDARGAAHFDQSSQPRAGERER